MTLLIVACRDQTIISRPELRSPTHGSATIVGFNDAWDAFAADVTVQGSHLGADGKPLVGQHALRYHLERQIKGANWNLVLTFAPRIRAITGQSAAASEALELNRFEDDGDGSPPRVYNGLGQQMTGGSPPALPKSQAIVSKVAAARANLSRAVTSARTSIPATVSPSSDRSWTESFVLTANGRSNRDASLRRRFGVPRRVPSGLDEFTVQRDSTTLTVEADPAIAAIVSMTEMVRGQKRLVWTISYDKAADGTATKREVRIEQPAQDGSGTSRVIDTQFTNVHFEKRNGQ